MSCKITIAETAGFCFGVDRAVSIAVKVAESSPVATLGPIVHNREVTRRLSEQNVREAQSVGDLRAGETAIIPSHGVPDIMREQLAGVPTVDATCPCVLHIHEIVRNEAALGRSVIIIGDPDHTEVRGIAGCCDCTNIFNSTLSLEKWLNSDETLDNRPVSVVAQTTLDEALWNKCWNILKKQCTNVKKFDTICRATVLRQREAASMAKENEAMVIVGDRMSANTRRLYEICSVLCKNVFYIGNADELLGFGNYSSVGITAGASTPKWIIEEVCRKMSDENKIIETGEETVAAENVSVEAVAEEAVVAKTVADEDAGEELSFADMLEDSLKTLNTGDKVTGVVTGISGNEIFVDLGTKHAGFIPLSEMSDDPSFKVEDVLKVGDEIEVYVVRVNDAEGVATLSKKRLDSLKGWEDVEAASESGDVLEGIVTEENKGGIVVSVRGVRVFVPSSQSGVPRGGSLTELLKTKVKLKITEVNRARHRVVGSIRAVENEARKAMSAQVWTDIDVGKRYSGVVKSIMSYGIFVDIGGVDGMVHISELSWKRVRHPSDVVASGDKVEVYVISFDAEKRKISLGMRNAEENPWSKFTAGFNIDDVIKASVVKLMPFGAFAEIIPGVDGLIHISQISDRRIAKPGDVLSEGQEVECKITNIDFENQKVWLSIRALMETTSEVPEEEQGVEFGDAVIATSEEGKLEIPAEDEVAKDEPVVEVVEALDEAPVAESTDAE